MPSRILVVDDSSSARRLVHDLLQPEGYDIELAVDGRDGLDKALALPPDLIISDVVMPNMDGYGLCRSIRADASLAQVPVLLLTTLDDAQSRLDGIEAGADDFIAKPFDATELRARVRTVTRLDRFRRISAMQKRFAWVVASAEDGYLCLDESGRVTYANPAARMMLGLLRDDASGNGDAFLANGTPFLNLARKLFVLRPEEAWDPWPPADTEVEPCYLIRPDSGTQPDLWLRADVLRRPASPQDVMLVRLKDVTTEKTNRRDLWTFQSMIAHKLRTPASGILFSLQMLADDPAGMGTEDIGSMASMALENMERLQGEIEDVLAYLRSPGTTDPQACMAVAGMRPMALDAASGLGIDNILVALDDSVATRMIRLTPQAVESILFELLENAKKFHPDQTPSVQIRIESHADDAVLLVLKDDGVHLAPEQLAQVFRPYFQGEKHTTFELAGMGLGLARTATLVWSVGGSCSLANRESGPGVCVRLVLPTVGCDALRSPDAQTP